MSNVITGCDSDEEVFWGPVTARELEIIWRRRMANKKEGGSANPVEKFIKNPEGLNKSSDKNIYSMSSNSSVQEVPTLQGLRNSSSNQKISFERNDDEHHMEDCEHESVGNESTLPLLEACMIINQDHTAIQNVSNSSGDNSNNDDISDQIILQKHEGHVKCEPEFSNQLDDSIENPKLIENIDLVHTTEEKMNSTFDNLNEIPQETMELHQPEDICKSMIDASKECYDSTTEGIETSDLSSTSYNTGSSDDYSNHDRNIEVVCIMSHNSPEAQQVACNSVQPESVISKSDNLESINLATSENQPEPSGSKIKTALNQSNIENIPPEELNNDSIEHKEMLDDLDVKEKIGPFRKNNASDHKVNGDNVLQELQIKENDDSMNSTHVLKIDASGFSDERSFVSLNSEESNSILSSNSHYSSLNQDCPETLIVKNKENEEPLSVQNDQDCVKSKIPVTNHIKSTVLKPSRLHPAPGSIDEKWLSDLKRKKIPKPKKPDYMVSPAKLGSILNSRNQPVSADKPTLIDLKRSSQPKIASSISKPIPGTSKTLLTPRKKQFECIKSPISEYIRTGKGIPTAKSLPALQSPNRIPVPITVKQTSVQKLPPKFYSSAEKLVIKPGSSSSVLKPTENRLVLTPKIFKHQGRVADLKKPGDINVVTPRAVRKTNLTETSFACLPQSSKKLEVSVLEEL